MTLAMVLGLTVILGMMALGFGAMGMVLFNVLVEECAVDADREQDNDYFLQQNLCADKRGVGGR